MTQTTANKIAAGLSEALDVACGKDTGATMHAVQTTQRVLLLESYCEDNANCTDALPCRDCVGLAERL